MKISIEIEVAPEEIPQATELFRILRAITQNVKARAPDNLYKALVARLGDPAVGEAAVPEIIGALEIGGITDENFGAFFNAFAEVVFGPEGAPPRETSVLPYFYNLLPRLPEPLRLKLRDKLVPHVVKVLTAKRPLECNRMEFFAYAEAFAALVKLEYVHISGAVTTIITLLPKPETRCAAITMLGKTVELCLPQLREKCDPNKLNELRVTLQKVSDEIFRYDVNYIEENMGWSRPAVAAAAVAPAVVQVAPQVVPIPQPAAVSQSASPAGLSSIGPIPTAAASASSASSPRAPTAVAPPHRTLTAATSWTGHRNTVFAIAYDNARDQLISSGKDGIVITWAKDGSQRQSFQLQKHYSCSMDINVRHRSLYLCGIAKETGTLPAIIAYSLNDRGQWVLRGTLERDAKLVSCVNALIQDQGNHFVVGESTKADKARISFYDVAGNTAFDELSPVQVYEEHTELITCLANSPSAEGIFFSGSRDCSLRMWDRRMSSSVGKFGTPAGGRVVAHDSMITCLDAVDNYLVSGSLDKKVAVWDLRAASSGSLSQPLAKFSVDENAVLKVAICPQSNLAAVSTLSGLHLVDLVAQTHTVATPFPDRRTVSRYHDLKWNATRDILFAAGEEGRVDIHHLT